MLKKTITIETFLRSDQPTNCPFCGARTDVILDFSHTLRQVQVHQCLNTGCAFTFFEEADLEPKRIIKFKSYRP